jgi:hypothetical protein
LTTLDLFLKSLPNDLHLISGHQKTPSSLYLCYSEEDFFKILNTFPEEQIVFRYFEKRPKETRYVHLALLKEKLTLQISIEVKNYTHDFGTKLCERFPSAEAYLGEF